MTAISALRDLVVELGRSGRIPAPCPHPERCDSYQCDVDVPLIRAYRAAKALVDEDDQRLIAESIAEWGWAMKVFVYGCVTFSGLVDKHGSYMNVNADGTDTCSFCGGLMGVPPRERARLRSTHPLPRKDKHG